MANDSNEKAKLTASLGLCDIERVDGRAMGGICPAQGGEMAQVKFKRHPTSVQVISCRHHQFSGGSHPCEGFHNGMVCYHAKAILIQSADESGYDLEFDSKPSEGCTPIFVAPAKIIYMKANARPQPIKTGICQVCHGNRGGTPGCVNMVNGVLTCNFCEVEGKVDACQVCHGNRGGEPGNENIVDGIVMCDHCHAEHSRKKDEEAKALLPVVVVEFPTPEPEKVAAPKKRTKKKQ